MQSNKFKKLTGKTLISAVDFSKHKHTGYFKTLMDEESPTFNFSNNREGFEKFWRKLQAFKNKHELDDIVVSFESTSTYGVPFIHFIREKEVRMIQVNPKHTKRTKEIADNSPNKTDKKDPRVIANLIKLGNGLTVNIAEGHIQGLKNHIYNRESIIEEQKRVTGRIESHLAVYFPELLNLFSSIQSKTMLHILRHYPIPEDLLQADPDKLKEELRKISRGRVDRTKTNQIIKSARESIGIKEGRESYRNTLKSFLEQLELFNRQKEEIEKAINDLLEDIPQSKILLSVKGLGKISVAAILSEIIDFHSFSTIREINKYSGVNLYEISSGKYQGKRRLAKRGRALLRKTLFFATLNMIRKGGIFYEQYHRHLNKGMPRMKAVVALSRKLLRIIFAIVRDQRDFDIEKIKTIKTAA